MLFRKVLKNVANQCEFLSQWLECYIKLLDALR